MGQQRAGAPNVGAPGGWRVKPWRSCDVFRVATHHNSSIYKLARLTMIKCLKVVTYPTRCEHEIPLETS